MDALQLRDNAKYELEQIKDIETGIDYLNKVKAIEVWAKAEKKDAELQNMIAEQKIRTQRILGRLIQDGQKAGEIAKPETGRPICVPSGNTYKTLSEIGISRKQSSTFQAIAEIPEQHFEKIIAESKAKVNDAINELTTAGIVKIAKELTKEQERIEKANIGELKSINVDFRLGDFKNVLSDIPDNSIDCIITDPPYPYEFIECWTDLAIFAKRVLKHNGFCIAYSGQYNLPEVIFRMTEYLDYYWTFAVYHEGQTQIVNAVNLICRWKPVLIFQNGKKKLQNTVQDYFISEQREKTGHDWQQSISGIDYLIEMFTKPGDIICEPFAGSGTTIKSALKKGRNIIASEIDETTYNIAKSDL